MTHPNRYGHSRYGYTASLPLIPSTRVLPMQRQARPAPYASRYIALLQPLSIFCFTLMATIGTRRAI